MQRRSEEDVKSRRLDLSSIWVNGVKEGTLSGIHGFEEVKFSDVEVTADDPRSVPKNAYHPPRRVKELDEPWIKPGLRGGPLY